MQTSYITSVRAEWFKPDTPEHEGNNYLVSYKSVVIPLATHLLLSNDDVKGLICGVLYCTVYCETASCDHTAVSATIGGW